MKRLLIVAALCLVFVPGALAQQSGANAPATKQDVEKFFQAFHMHHTLLRMAEAMSAPMHTMVHAEYLKDKEKCNYPPDFEARMDKILDEQMKSMPWDKLMQAIVPVYQRHFTKGDMAALTAFYSGPTGQKFIRETPALGAESMEVVMPIMLEQNKAMTQRIKEEMERAKKYSKNKSCTGESTEKH